MTLPKHTLTGPERVREFVKLGKEIGARFRKVHTEPFPDNALTTNADIWDYPKAPVYDWKD